MSDPEINGEPAVQNDDASSTQMFNYSYMFVRIYSRLQDGEHTASVSIHPSGERLLLQVYNRQGELFECSYTEQEVDGMKRATNASLSWVSFFELLQKAFAEHTLEFYPQEGTLMVTIKHERQSEAIPLPAFTSTVPVTVVKVSKPGCIEEMTKQMISYVSLRSGDKRELERVEDVVRVESAVKEDASLLKQELQNLKEETAMLQKMKAAAEAEEKQLLQQAQAKFSNTGEVINNRAAVETALLRQADPMEKRGATVAHAPHDAQLLKMLKSRSLQTSSIAMTSFRHSNVIPPMSRADVETAIANLTSDPPRRDFMRALGQFEEWEFDLFHFEKLCKGLKTAGVAGASGAPAGPLFMLAYNLFFKCGFVSEFNMSEEVLISWLSMMERGHNPLPFTNALHAADMLQALHFMVYVSEGMKRFNLSKATQLSLFMAAMTVGFNHDGLNNAYHCASKSYKATLYSDQSPTQRANVGAVFELMRLPRYRLLDGIARERCEQIEDAVANLVIGTDMARHEQTIHLFRQRLLEGCEFEHEADQFLAAQVMLNAATVAFCAKPADIYAQWTKGSLDEYKKLSEKASSSGVAPDLLVKAATTANKDLQAKVVIPMINSVAHPLFSLLSDQLPKLRSTGDYVSLNRASWAPTVQMSF